MNYYRIGIGRNVDIERLKFNKENSLQFFEHNLIV